MSKRYPFVLVLLVVLVLVCVGCRRRVYIDNCTTPENICVSGGVIISFSTAPGYSANQLTVTREVNPTELEYKGGAARYTVTVTLNNGATVTHSGLLVYTSARNGWFSSITPGHRIYAFAPADQTSLQAFIDRYRPTAVSADIETNVALADISNGTDPSAVVDVQGEDRGDQDYIGSITAELPRWREGRDPIEM